MTSLDNQDETRLLDEPGTPAGLHRAIRAARAQGTTPAQRALMLAAVAPLIGTSGASAAVGATTAATTTAKISIGWTLAAAVGGAAVVGALVWSLATSKQIAPVARQAPGVVPAESPAQQLAPLPAPSPGPAVAPGHGASGSAEKSAARDSSPRRTASSAKRPAAHAAVSAEVDQTESARPAQPAGPAQPAQPAIVEAVKLLEKARAALAHDPAWAWTLALRHRQMFPEGPMVQEREVIAIEALVRLGRIDDANARARQFHRDFSDSIHLRHIDGLLAPATP